VTPISCLFFFSLFFYHAFIGFRYKKLRAALAMERTKPINQNISTKETIFLVHRVLLKVLRPKPLARRSFMETKYKEITTLNYFSFTRFLQGEILREEFKHPASHNVGSSNKRPPRGTMCFSMSGRGEEGGGIVVGEHARGKAGFCVCDVLA